MKYSVILLFVLINTFSVLAQTESHEGHNHEQNQHQHPKNEIGVANSPVYYLKEKEFTYGLHVHYIRTIGDSKFGLGLGYEQIFDEHEHKTIGFVASYRPFHGFSVNLSPGITFEKHIEDNGEIIESKETVYYDESLGAWMLDQSDKQDRTYGASLFENITDYEYKIIGNVFENPELLCQ